MDKRVIRAKIKLMLDRPFWGSLIVRLQLQEWDSDTFATEGKHIFVPKDVSKYTDEDLLAILAHETAHCALLHPFRINNRNHLKWNVACDYATNLLITKDNFKLPGKPLSMKEFISAKTDTTGRYLFDEELTGINTEKIYSMLPDPIIIKIPIDVLNPQNNSSGKDGKGKNKKGDKDGNSQNKTEIEVSGYNVDPKELEQEWKEAVSNALQVAKSKGDLPGGLEEYINDYLYAKISWEEILYKYLQVSKGKSDYTMYPFNRAHIYREIYLPSLQGDMIELCLAVDTSGSVSKEDLTMYISRVRDLCSIFGEYIIHFWMCDAKIQGDDYIITEDSEVPNLMMGRGGTSFKPIFKRIEELELENLPVVYFTDLAGDFPDIKRNDVYWVTRKDQRKWSNTEPPFGTIIEIDE